MARCAVPDQRGNSDVRGALRIESGFVVRQHLELRFRGRIAHDTLEQEAIELRLRQRIRALVFRRILRRKYGEHFVERARATIDGDLPFRHRLEQRRLRFCRCAIYLVGE